MVRDREWNRSSTGGPGWTRLALALAAAALPAPSAAQVPPNILIVSVDDVGVDQWASYGEAGACSASGAQCLSSADCPSGQSCDEDYAATPTIDQLAAEGVLFRNAWAYQQCKPSRAAAMSGRYGLRTGIVSNQGTLALVERTIADALKDPAIVPQVYETAAFGKWGLAAAGGATHPNDQGFDHFAGSIGSAIGGDFFSWNRTVNGTTSSCSAGSAACPAVSYATTVNVDDALDWLDGRTGPWFVWFSFNAPHSPWQIPPHDLVSPGTLARLPQEGGGQPLPEGTECAGADRRICYMAMLEAADAELARLLAAVPSNTWVVVWGDNGTPRAIVRAPFDDTQGKGTIYEGGINVPLIVRAPDARNGGSETASLTHVVDFIATAVDIAGGLPPTGRQLDSISLVPLVDDPALSARAALYGETDDSRAARDARFKIIGRATYDELYDLEGAPPGLPADPFEQADLLLGACSGGGPACHVDAECPGTCEVPPLTPDAQASLAGLRDVLDGAATPAGRVPDGRFAPGAPLTVSDAGAGEVLVAWSPSCDAGDVDYAVYEGGLGDFASHLPVACSTAGATSATFAPDAGSRYFLAVPSNGVREGSYGTRGNGLPRPPSTAACAPQFHAGCP